MSADQNPGLKRSLRLVLPATHRDLRLARNLLRRLVRVEGLAEREIEVLLLVASELLANAVDHGGGAAAMSDTELADSVAMTMEFELGAREWCLRVEDQGGGDPEELRAILHPDGPPDLEDERGRGFFLLSDMVDGLEAEVSSDGLGIALIATHRHAQD